LDGKSAKVHRDLPIDISPGVMTWWREISKLTWAVVATATEVFRGKEMNNLWPGMLSMATIMIVRSPV